jgi:hypothetical protein
MSIGVQIQYTQELKKKSMMKLSNNIHGMLDDKLKGKKDSYSRNSNSTIL